MKSILTAVMLFIAPMSWAGVVSVVITGQVDSAPGTVFSIRAGDAVTARFLINLDADGLVIPDTTNLRFDGDWIGYSAGIIDGTVTIGSSVSLPYAAFDFQGAPGVLMRNDATLLFRGNPVSGPLDGMRFGGLDPAAAPAPELEIDGQMVFRYEAFFDDSTETAFTDASLPSITAAAFGDFDSARMEIAFSEFPVPDPSTSILISLDSYSVTVVPIPAAAWLFVSAIGLLGCSRARFG